MLLDRQKPRYEYDQEPGEKVRYIVGCDLGQTIDSTAISVIEHRTTRQGIKQRTGKVERSDVFQCRHLERLPLGVSYIEQAKHVAGLMKTAPIRDHGTLVIDQTGVGRAVFDIFRSDGLRPVAVTITGGDTETRTPEGWRVPKLQLVSRLQAMLHAGDLQIAKNLPEAETLANELSDFRVQFNEGSGFARFGAREGRHDDLVLSLAIGVWYAARPQNVMMTSRPRGLM